MRAAFSMICGVVAWTCLATCLHVSSSHHNCSCLLCWALCITGLDGSLLWSPYLQFACSVELCGSLLCLPIFPIQRPPLPTSHKKWFTVGIRSGKFVHWRSFSVSVLVGGCLQGWFPLTGLPWNLPAEPGICTGPPPTFDGTSSQAYQLGMSLKRDKNKCPNFCSCNTYNRKKPFICTFCFRK